MLVRGRRLSKSGTHSDLSVNATALIRGWHLIQEIRQMLIEKLKLSLSRIALVNFT